MCLLKPKQFLGKIVHFTTPLHSYPRCIVIVAGDNTFSFVINAKAFAASFALRIRGEEQNNAEPRSN